MDVITGLLGLLWRHKKKTLGVAGLLAAVHLYKKYHVRGPVIDTERHGGQLVAQVLKAHGVKFLFTLVGGHISPILVASKQAGIRVIDVRHEVNAVFAADAVARLTGVPGVAAVTAGPGVTNTITAIKNAQMAESPLVLIGGAAATLTKGRGSLQDIDQMVLLKPIVKWCATCTRVGDIVPVMRRAFQEAMSGTPGPVFVELPIDVLYPIMELRANMGLSTRRLRRQVTSPEDVSAVMVPVEHKGLSPAAYLETRKSDHPVFLKRLPARLPWFVRAFLTYKLNFIFGGAFTATDRDMVPLPVRIPMPSSADVSRAVGMLREAKRPVLLIASQATLSPGKLDRMVEAVNLLGIPCFLGGMARGLLGRNSKYHVRQNRRGALKEADLVIMAGTVADFRLDYGRVLSKRSKVIAVNRTKENLHKNTDLFWSPALRSNADPCEFLLELLERAGPQGGRFDEWAAKLKAAEVAKEEANARKAAEPARGRGGVAMVNPLRLCQELEDALPDKSILIGDGGDFVATASYIVRPRGPLQWLDPGAFGTLGVGAGFALGAKLARPDHEVWLIWGDGSVGYSVAEFDTCFRHGVPICALVGNDAAWTQIERDQVPILGDNVACPLEYTPYEDVARGYGGEGAAVSRPEQDIAAAIAAAQDSAADGTSFLVNVHIGKTDFREGSLSV